MPEVLDWQRADPQAVVQRAVRTLTGGGLVAFPTETVYQVAASALRPEAVARLHALSSAAPPPALTLAVRGPADALDWAPALSALGRRLARRCWPGPVAFLLDPDAGGLLSRLPAAARDRLCTDGLLGLQAPGHEAVVQALQLLGEPLVLGFAGPSPQAPAVTAEDLLQAAAEEIAVVVDDGRTGYACWPTLVRLNGPTWSVVREGVVPAAMLAQLAPCIVVFVCTGNTCRSPLAEALCKKLLAERLGCAVDELPGRGFQVLSAGLGAMGGAEAAAEAVEAARELGADLTGHRSRRLGAELLEQADHLVVMTRGHLQALERHGLAGAAPPRLLSCQGEDVADPIGGDQELYRACARQIQHCLETLVTEFVEG